MNIYSPKQVLSVHIKTTKNEKLVFINIKHN